MDLVIDNQSAGLEGLVLEGAPQLVQPRRVTAVSVERVHCILRRMPEAEWARFTDHLLARLPGDSAEAILETLAGFFRHDRQLAPGAGGLLLRGVDTITAAPELRAEIAAAHERLRGRVRFILREMAEPDWRCFREHLSHLPGQQLKPDELDVLELVFRVGESVSNVEVAAAARAHKAAGRKLLDPEIARRNARLRAGRSGANGIDPDAAYATALRALEQATETARRAENTLASRYVKPSAAFRHARHTVFKLIDSILERDALMSEACRFESELLAVPEVSRDKMRWALHRMPVQDRMEVLKLIPLNTVLMFQCGETLRSQDLDFKATRDRRLAYDFFVRGAGEQELAAGYGLTSNALKNAIGIILESLRERPLARKAVSAFVEQAQKVEPMAPDELRRRLKRLAPEQRAELVTRIPSCAWKIRDVIPLHKHLFLDYMSGEWVLGALVNFYNLQKSERLAGTFRRTGRLTVRGALSAIEGMLAKIADEPGLRRSLIDWTSGASPFSIDFASATPEVAPEPTVEDLMPPRAADPAELAGEQEERATVA